MVGGIIKGGLIALLVLLFIGGILHMVDYARPSQFGALLELIAILAIFGFPVLVLIGATVGGIVHLHRTRLPITEWTRRSSLQIKDGPHHTA